MNKSHCIPGHSHLVELLLELGEDAEVALDVLPEGFVEHRVQRQRQGALRGEILQELLQHWLVQLPGLAGKSGMSREVRYYPGIPAPLFAKLSV